MKSGMKLENRPRGIDWQLQKLQFKKKVIKIYGIRTLCVGETSATVDESSVNITRASVTERAPVVECELPGELKSTRIGSEIVGLSVPI